MNFSNLTAQLFTFFDHLSKDYGTGDIVNDFVIAILLIILGLIVLSVVGRLVSGPRAQPISGFERTGAALGRLEKVEMTLNTFKTEAMRSSQMVASDLGFLKHELQEIRKLLSGQASLDLAEHYGSTGGYEPHPERDSADDMDPVADLEELPDQDFEKKN
jgi:hypothetical protein